MENLGGLSSAIREGTKAEGAGGEAQSRFKSMTHNDLEVSRMQDKCKSYENEVGRLRGIHAIEVNKLKLRITSLEKLVKAADTLSSTFFEMFSSLHLQSLRSLESLLSDTQFEFTLMSIGNRFLNVKECIQNDQVQEFIAKRRLFSKAAEQIKTVETLSYEGHNSVLHQVQDLVKTLKAGGAAFTNKQRSERGIAESDFDYNSRSESPKLSLGRFPFSGNGAVTLNRVMPNSARGSDSRTDLHRPEYKESLDDLFSRVTIKIVETKTEESTVRACQNGISRIMETVESTVMHSGSHIAVGGSSNSSTGGVWTREDITKLEETVQAAEEKFKKFEESRTTLGKTLADLKAQIDDKEKKIYYLEDETTALKEKVAEGERASAAFDRQIKELTTERSQKEAELTELGKKQADLKSKYEEGHKTNTGLDSKLSVVKAEIRDLEDRILRAETDIVSEESGLYTKNQHIEDLNRMIETKTQRLEDCRARIVLMENDRVKKEKKNSDLDAEIEKMIDSMKAREKQLQELKAAHSQKVKKREAVDQTLAQLSAELKECMQGFSELETEIKSQNGKLQVIAEEAYLSEEEAERSLRENLLTMRDKSREMLGRLRSNIERLEVMQTLQTNSNRGQVGIEESEHSSELETNWMNSLEKLDKAVRSQSINQAGLLESFRKIISGIKTIEDKVIEAEKRQVQFGELVANRSISLTVDIEKLDKVLQAEKVLAKSIERVREQIKEDEGHHKVVHERIGTVAEQLLALDRQVRELSDTVLRQETTGRGVSRQDSSKNLTSTISSISRQVSSSLEWLKKKRDESEGAVSALSHRERELETQIKDALDEEGALLIEIDQIENTISEVRNQIESKQLELSRIEGRIETLRSQFDNVQSDSAFSQESVHKLNSMVSKHMMEYNQLESSVKQDFISKFAAKLTLLSANEKASVVGYIGLLYDTSLRSAGITPGDSKAFGGSTFSQTYESGKKTSDSGRKEDSQAGAQASIVDSIRHTIYTSIDLTIEVKTRMEEILQRYKREERKYLSLGQSSSANSEAEEIDAKEWRNALKHIANLVSYMMRTSSVLVNLGGVACKRAIPSGDRRMAAKTKSLKFSEEIFERHKKLIQIVKHFEESQQVGLKALALFSRKVSEAGKEELSTQEGYLDSLVQIIGKD